MLAHNHYEVAFQDYLQDRAVPFVCMDEHKRSVLGGSAVKSFDFLVYPPSGRKWIVDIKGRKYPYESGTRQSVRFWENWVTRADILGLSAWEDVFLDFEAYFIFAYWVLRNREDFLETGLHTFQGNEYSFLAVPIGVYEARSRERSEKWDTVGVPAKIFQSIAKPLEQEWEAIAESQPLR